MDVDHLGIAVRSLAATLATYQGALGLYASPAETIPSQSVRAAFVEVGATHLEFLEPTSPGSPVGRFLDTRGEGLHHIAFRVPDVDGMLSSLSGRGVPLIDRVGRPGARGRRVGFAHPKAFHGVLVEFVEGT